MTSSYPCTINASTYAITYRNFGVNPAADEKAKDISPLDVYTLAEKDIEAAINFLKRLSFKDRNCLLAGIKNLPNANKKIIKKLEDAAGLSIAFGSPYAGISNINPKNYAIYEKRNGGTHTYELNRIRLETNNNSPLLRPLKLPSPFEESFLGDGELRLTNEIYTKEANCVAYALKDLIPRLPFTDEGGKPLKWYDVFISSNDTLTINAILEKYATKIRAYSKDKGEETEEFAYKVEQNILSNTKIKEGDILAISYLDADGTRKYHHLAILTQGENKRLVLKAKFGAPHPIIQTSIGIQILFFAEGATRGLQIEIYRGK